MEWSVGVRGALKRFREPTQVGAKQRDSISSGSETTTSASTVDQSPIPQESTDPDRSEPAVKNAHRGGKTADTVELHMSGSEAELFRQSLGGRQFYLEFGCGGSTVAAAQANVPRIVSVESDAKWIAMLQRQPTLRKRGSGITFHHADVGPTGDWGCPTSDESAISWPTYARDVWTLIGDDTPDIVLIDGRWRVACALHAILRCPPETLLLFHDFWNRRHYHTVLNYTDQVASAGTLAVLRPRNVIDYPSLAIHLAEHILDYR